MCTAIIRSQFTSTTYTYSKPIYTNKAAQPHIHTFIHRRWHHFLDHATKTQKPTQNVWPHPHTINFHFFFSCALLCLCVSFSLLCVCQFVASAGSSVSIPVPDPCHYVLIVLAKSKAKMTQSTWNANYILPPLNRKPFSWLNNAVIHYIAFGHYECLYREWNVCKCAYGVFHHSHRSQFFASVFFLFGVCIIFFAGVPSLINNIPFNGKYGATQ